MSLVLANAEILPGFRLRANEHSFRCDGTAAFVLRAERSKAARAAASQHEWLSAHYPSPCGGSADGGLVEASRRTNSRISPSSFEKTSTGCVAGLPAHCERFWTLPTVGSA